MSSAFTGDTAQFPARMAALGDAFAIVQAFCAGHAIVPHDALRLKLVVEELFTNSVRHGYGAEGDFPIRIALDATPEAIDLGYEDEAPPFDPCVRVLAPAADASRPAGGLGLHLLCQLAQDMRYLREAGRNRLWLRLRRTPADAADARTDA